MGSDIFRRSADCKMGRLDLVELNWRGEMQLRLAATSMFLMNQSFGWKKCDGHQEPRLCS